MTRAEKIANFIRENNPRRKDIIRFIEVDLNGLDADYFEQRKYGYRGSYSTNFTTWKRNQKVHVCPKTKRYSLTEYYEKYGKLYSMPLEVKVKMLKSANKNIKDAYRVERYKRIIAERKLEEIEKITTR